MPPPQFSDPGSTAFLVERYLPEAAAGGLPDSVARVASRCADPADGGSGVQYLHSAYLPSEDTCFCLFRATSADAVRRVNGEAGFAFDRITIAIVLHPADPHPFLEPAPSVQPARTDQPTEESP